MHWPVSFRAFSVAAAMAIPAIALGQGAAISPPSPPLEALTPSAPAQDPAAAPSTAPAATIAEPRRVGTLSTPGQDPAAPRAVRARTTTRGDEPVAPALATPALPPSTGMTYYAQTAPFYRYNVPLDKEMQELVKKESELAKKTSDLVASLKGATAEKKAEIRTQLVTAVEAHFAARQEQRELQLKRIEEEVKKLREAIEKRNTAKKEIIERRVAELTGEDTIGF